MYRKVMDLVNQTVSRYHTAGKELGLKIDFKFFGGRVNIITDPENLQCSKKILTVNASYDDTSDFLLEIPLSVTTAIDINEKKHKFSIINCGVTGILNQKVDFALVEV